jgi:hypothetical protein
MDAKQFVNEASLPGDDEFPPQMDAFRQTAAAQSSEVRLSNFSELGLQKRTDLELRLGEHVGHQRSAQAASLRQPPL